MLVELCRLQLSETVVTLSCLSDLTISGGVIMEQWIDLLFSNAIGVMTIAVVFGAIMIAVFLLTMRIVNSSDHN